MSKIMVVAMVNFVNMWLNFFFSKKGAFTTISSRTLFTGTSPDYKLHCQAPFGAYVQMHTHNTDNIMKPHTIGAIVLGPIKNMQGGYYFISLLSGRCIHGRKWTVILATYEIICHVYQLARRSKLSDELAFYDRSGNPDPDPIQITGVEDEDDDEDSDNVYIENDDSLETTSSSSKSKSETSSSSGNDRDDSSNSSGDNDMPPLLP